MCPYCHIFTCGCGGQPSIQGAFRRPDQHRLGCKDCVGMAFPIARECARTPDRHRRSDKDLHIMRLVREGVAVRELESDSEGPPIPRPTPQEGTGPRREVAHCGACGAIADRNNVFEPAIDAYVS